MYFLVEYIKAYLVGLLNIMCWALGFGNRHFSPSPTYLLRTPIPGSISACPTQIVPPVKSHQQSKCLRMAFGSPCALFLSLSLSFGVCSLCVSLSQPAQMSRTVHKCINILNHFNCIALVLMSLYGDFTVIKIIANAVFVLSIKLLTQVTVMNQRTCSWGGP